MKKKLIMGVMFATMGATSMPTFAQEDLFAQENALKAAQLTDGAVIAFKGIAADNQNWINFSGTNTTSPIATGIFIVEDDPNGESEKILLKRASDGQYIGKEGENIKFVTDIANASSFSIATPSIVSPDITDPVNVSLPDWAQSNEVEGYQLRFATSDGYYLNVQSGGGTPRYASGKGSWSIMMAYDASDKLEAYYPFEISKAPANGAFSENTHWYQLTLRNKYATYTHGQENISLTSTQPQSKGSFWAFVRNDNGGLEIYNAEAGANMVLTLDLPQTNKAPVYMAEKSGIEGQINTWSIKINGDVFYLKNTKEENAYFLNDADNANIIKVWKDAESASDGGSQFRIMDIDEVILNTKSKYASCNGAVGTLIEEQYQKFCDALEKGTFEGLLEAFEIDGKEENKILFEPNKWYRIMNSATDWDDWTGRKYLTAGSTLTATDLVSANASQIWKIGSAEDKYTLESQGVYSVAPVNTTTNVATTNEEQDAALFTMAPRAGQCSYSFMVGSMYLHFKKADHESINGFDGIENASFWYLYPAATIELEITDAGYATANYPFAVQLPADGTLKAYTGEVQNDTDGKVLLLTEVPEGKVPANTPVVLEGKGNYTLTIDTENTNVALETALLGTLLPTVIPVENTVYGLGYVDNVIGFYKMSDGDRTIGANKAYLPSTLALQGVRGVTFSFDDNSGETTGIEHATINLAEEEFYDLQGRRVMNPTKGIYVTKSGKKVLFTK